jgi:microcystin-dependent protein
MSSCGCSGGSGSTPDLGLNSQPVHAYEPPVYSQPADASEKQCIQSHCDSRFEGLQRHNGLRLPGLLGKCFRTLAGGVRGLVQTDPDGTSYVTDQIQVQLPENVAYQKDASGSYVFIDGSLVKIQPPAFKSLFGWAGGFWKRIVGRAGSRQYPVWNGSEFTMEDVPDWGGNRPVTDYPLITAPCGVTPLGVVVTRQAGTDSCGNTVHRDIASVGRIGYHVGIVGEMRIFGGTQDKIPPGWLYCNGGNLSKTTWPELFAAIGYAWGGSGDSFNLPDMRGRFPRGLDDAAGRDSSTSRAVGSYQEDSVIQHQHSASSEQSDSPSANFQLNTGNAAAPEENEAQVSVYSATGTLGAQVISATVAGLGLSVSVGNVAGTDKVATESRPKNAAVLFMIYAGCQAQVS